MKMLKREQEQRQAIEMLCVDMLVPKDHLLRKIDAAVDFTHIYDLVEDLYCEDNGRPSCDPVVLFKLVLIQHLFGIRSLRQTMKDAEVNVAYRWFLGYTMSQPLPHFATISYAFCHRFTAEVIEGVFRWVLEEVSRTGYLSPEVVFVDGTHIKANANLKKHVQKQIPIAAKNPDNPKRWIVDEEAARVVRRIYSLTMDGFGSDQIATLLNEEKVLVPMAYWARKGINRAGKTVSSDCTAWCRATVIKILTMQEYCGDLINFKTYSKSYKNKKRIENDPENMVVFREINEPIIDRATWEKVQEKRGKIRKRKPQDGERNMFSGLVVCADCGKNLNYHFNQGNHDIRYFNCSNYNSGHGTCNATHYIRVDFLEQVVLGEIRRLTKFASHYESDFVKAVMGHSQQAVVTERQYKEKELHKLLTRDKELDKLFERLYEDNVAGKITDERYARMARNYEDEQQRLAEKIKDVKAELDKQTSTAMTTDMFIACVRK